MFSRTVILILGVALSFVYTLNIEDYASKDWGKYQIYDRNARAECTQFGPMCDNCTHSVFCLPNATGGFDKSPLETCSNGTTCLNGACTDAENDECNPNIIGYKFECHQLGVFPDPYDCKKYHFCSEKEEDVNGTYAVNIVSTVIDCPLGYGFDVYRMMCIKELVNNTCSTELVKPCEGSRVGPIPGNTNLFYICMKSQVKPELPYMPQIFACEKNYVYYNNQCVTPSPIGVVNSNCTRTGNFTDPTDCRKYKECPTIGVRPTEKSCSLNYRFQPLPQKCEQFTCK